MSTHDESQREIVRNRLDKSIVVTAGAGSGKTRELVERYLNLIQKNRTCTPDQILALTFTNKAAAEMKKRIRSEFQDVSANESMDIKTQLAFAPVMTFHAFCTALLREFAIEAGVDPEFRVLDDAEKNVLEEKVFLDLLRRPKEEEQTALTHILTIYGKSQLQKILGELTEDSDTCDNVSAFFKQDKEMILNKWEAFLDPIRKQAINSFFADGKAMQALQIVKNAGEGVDQNDKAVEYFNKIRSDIQKITKNTPPEELTHAITDILSQKKLGNSGSKKIWKEGEEDLEEVKNQCRPLLDRFEKLQENLKLTIDPDAAHTDVTLKIIAELLIVAHGYSHRLNEEMRKDGSLRFSDLISRTKHFLKENSDIAKEIRGRYRYIFIDEFQDTDPAQFEIIKSIIGTLEECTGLFIVGDPNQSIYLFRGAAVTLFGLAQNTFEKSHAGEIAKFSVCFRSTPEVIGCVNHVFFNIFPKEQTDENLKKSWEFPHTETYVSDKRSNHLGSVQILLAGDPDSKDTIEIARKHEAKLIAKTIKTHLNKFEDCKPRDIAILIEKRTHLRTYQSALKEAGLDYIVEKGIEFYTLPEVLDLYSILSFICTPHDDCALLAVLRSPYFSLSDRSITILALKSRGFCLWDKMRFVAEVQKKEKVEEERKKIEPLFDDEYKRVLSAHKLLKEWVLFGWTKPLQTSLNNILDSSQICELYAALPDGEQKIANLKKLIELILERSTDTGYGIVDAVEDIKRSIESKEQEGEAELARNAIKVMTIHAAKGREFPVVVLAGLSDGKTGDRLPIHIGENSEEFGITVPDPDADYEMRETPIFTALRLLYEKKEFAERKRLLYVGMTRARDHLILSGTRPKKETASIADGKSKMDWLCSVFNIDPQRPPSQVEFTVDDRYIKIPIITDNGDESEYTRDEQKIVHSGEIYRWIHKPAKKATEKKGTLQIEMSSLARKSSRSSEKKKDFKIPKADHLQPDQLGTLIHEIFSGISVDLILKRYGIDDEEAIKVCQGYYQKFKTLSILQNVHEEYTELSCSLFLPDLNVKLQGKIDRLCRTDDGWVIIDYKTGTADPEEFQPVLESYSRAAERLVKEPVTAYLYEIASHTLIPVAKMEDEAFSLLVDGKARELLS